jgi:hypothetical protein
MTNLKITPIKDTNEFVNTQDLVESIINQFTTKEKTSNPSTNHGYEGGDKDMEVDLLPHIMMMNQ